MHFMKGFGLGAVIGLKETTSYQVAQWTFGKFLVPLGIPKIIVVDADGLFPGMFKKNFQDTLLIMVHSVARSNHKAIRN